MLTALAYQLTVAIENARLFEQANKHAQRLLLLNQLGSEISALTDLPTLMETVYRQIERMLRADLFFIGLYNTDSNTMTFPIMYGGGEHWVPQPGPVTEGTLSGKSILSRKPLLINHWTDSAITAEAALIPDGDAARRTNSLMFAPMLYGESVIGVSSGCMRNRSM